MFWCLHVWFSLTDVVERDRVSPGVRRLRSLSRSDCLFPLGHCVGPLQNGGFYYVMAWVDSGRRAI